MKRDYCNILSLKPASGVFVPVTQSDFDTIERRIGRKFPADVAEFLGSYGWSSCASGAMVRLSSDQSVRLEYFLGGGSNERSLLYYFDEWVYGDEASEEFPPELIPIAESSMGPLFCVSVRNDSFGAIFVVDTWGGLGQFEGQGNRRNDIPPDGERVGAYYIAPDFDTFVDTIEFAID